MTQEEKFLQLLYPTEDIRKIMINDVYQELLERIPTTWCISSKNLTKAIREENYKKVLSSISNFIEENSDYKKVIQSFYRENIEYVLYGFMFYISHTNEKYTNVDIFKDKRSILYSEISLLDIL